MRRKLLRRLALLFAAVMLLVLALPGLALAQKGPSTAELSLAMDTVWVIVAACLVLFMQAGFAMLEVGFSRMKNVGSVVAKILVNLAIAALLFWAFGFRAGLRHGQRARRHRGLVPRGSGRAGQRRVRGALVDAGSALCQVPLPGRLLRGLSGHRVGHHARADQVRRVCDLRRRLRRAHLPHGGTLDLGRRLADGAGHAGLRRLHGRPPLRRHGRARWHPAAGSPARQVRRRRPAGNYSRATTCRSPFSAS